MTNKLFAKLMAGALAVAMTVAAAVPALAAEKDPEETTGTSQTEVVAEEDAVTPQSEDQGDSTEENDEVNSIYEQLEAIFSEILEKADGLSEADINAIYEQYQDEINSLLERLEKLGGEAIVLTDDATDDAGDGFDSMLDTSKLTDEEVEQLEEAYARLEEIYEAIYDGADDLTDEEFEARYAEYADEIDALYEQIEALEKKAGWYDGFYGDLTDEEIAQLESLYDQVEAIYEKIYDGADDLTDEEFEARYAEYEDELDALYEQIEVLEEKAGWYDDWSDDWDDAWDGSFYGDLTDEEIAQLESLYNQVEAIFEKIYDGADDLTDEEFEARYAEYADELDALYEQIAALEEKAGWTVEFSVDQGEDQSEGQTADETESAPKEKSGRNDGFPGGPHGSHSSSQSSDQTENQTGDQPADQGNGLTGDETVLPGSTANEADAVL